MITLSVVEFAAKRRTDQDTMEKELFPEVSQAIAAYPVEGWYNDLLAEVAKQYLAVFHNEGGQGQPKPTAAEFTAEVRATLDKTKNPTEATVDRVSTWLATAILNAGTQAAAATDEEFLVMEWVTMHDEDVRETHQVAEGQQRPPGEPFAVGGAEMRYPGDPTAPIELWINCRCTLAPLLAEDATFRKTEGVTMTTTTNTSGSTMNITFKETEPEQLAKPDGPIPWYGVLAPEGVWSGDKRQFLPNSLEFRDLPLPLTWQKETDDGHKKSVTVASIENIERIDNLLHASGTFMDTPEADEAIGLIAHFGRYGVSVDADDVEMELDEEAESMSFSKARISGASIVGIPAFAEAFIAIGTTAAEEDITDTDVADVCDPESDDYDEALCAEQQAARLGGLNTFVSDKPWSDFSESDYTDEQYYRACCLHRNGSSKKKSDNGLPIKEPGGALNRNGVHAAASRFGSTQGPTDAKAAAKSCIRGAYRQLGEDPPDALKASAGTEEFVDPKSWWDKRGKGWVTHPKETRRIHNYWTQPGQPGYAKIAWGTGGDFNRCRALVGEKIATNSPEDMRYINQICAQWHHDALGIWPGEHLGAEVTLPEGEEQAPALTLTASGGFCAPSEWFQNPGLTQRTPLTVTDEGRVFGHLAEWGTCHVGFDGVCVDPPRSATDYAYFLTGEVDTDAGTIPVGNITIDGPHAPLRMKARPAMAHYDNTSTVVADVTCGEDDIGIWVAGWVRPGTPDEKVYALKASGGLSGDWRTVNGHPRELIAALAVNSGGFPVPRVGIKDGVQVSLVAAGCVTCEEEQSPTEALAVAVAFQLRMIEARREKMKALAERVGGRRTDGL